MIAGAEPLNDLFFLIADDDVYFPVRNEIHLGKHDFQQRLSAHRVEHLGKLFGVQPAALSGSGNDRSHPHILLFGSKRLICAAFVRRGRQAQLRAEFCKDRPDPGQLSLHVLQEL